MPKTILPNISIIKQQFRQFSFKEHEVFHWSPRDNCIYYDPIKLTRAAGVYQLLHEIGHALSGHTNYESGIQLLKMETEAWQQAQRIAKSYNLKISETQIERCLDSYRDWLHLRSKCPSCSTTAVETEANLFHCFNCLQDWKVPADQRSRSYRLKLVNQLI
ncbi:MAG: hypothetical protein U0520_00865 [Candidatus Saccharimonadales bacterium]